MTKDVYSTIGASLKLLAASSYHQDFLINEYFHTQILPPINNNLIYIYYTKDGVPAALATAAWINEKTLEELTESSTRILQPSEWIGGNNLFFNDLVALYKNGMHVFYHLVNNIYPSVTSAYSTRKRKCGEIRKVNRWRRRQL